MSAGAAGCSQVAQLSLPVVSVPVRWVSEIGRRSFGLFSLWEQKDEASANVTPGSQESEGASRAHAGEEQ